MFSYSLLQLLQIFAFETKTRLTIQSLHFNRDTFDVGQCEKSSHFLATNDTWQSFTFGAFTDNNGRALKCG